MKPSIPALILFLIAPFAFSEELPDFLDGPVWGHLASTNPLSEQVTSHPKREVLGSISNGTLTFQSHVLRDFQFRESGRFAEYRNKTEKLDVSISFLTPFSGLYTITIKTPEGGYKRYNLKIKK